MTNVGIQNSDAGELPRRKHTAFRTRRNFETKKCYRYLYLLVSINRIISFFSFACLGLYPEAQLLNCSGGIYVLKVFINPSMPDSVHCAGFFHGCNPRCIAPLCVHFKALSLYKPSVLGSSWKLKPILSLKA